MLSRRATDKTLRVSLAADDLARELYRAVQLSAKQPPQSWSGLPMMLRVGLTELAMRIVLCLGEHDTEEAFAARVFDLATVLAHEIAERDGQPLGPAERLDALPDLTK